jgi:hypothetical protein
VVHTSFAAAVLLTGLYVGVAWLPVAPSQVICESAIDEQSADGCSNHRVDKTVIGRASLTRTTASTSASFHTCAAFVRACSIGPDVHWAPVWSRLAPPVSYRSPLNVPLRI